jgi:hypothetical protein
VRERHLAAALAAAVARAAWRRKRVRRALGSDIQAVQGSGGRGAFSVFTWVSRRRIGRHERSDQQRNGSDHDM